MVKHLVITRTIKLRKIQNDSTTLDTDISKPTDLSYFITQSGRVHGSAFTVVGGSGLESLASTSGTSAELSTRLRSKADVPSDPLHSTTGNNTAENKVVACSARSERMAVSWGNGVASAEGLVESFQ